jgi:hypothetical protein
LNTAPSRLRPAVGKTSWIANKNHPPIGSRISMIPVYETSPPAGQPFRVDHRARDEHRQAERERDRIQGQFMLQGPEKMQPRPNMASTMARALLQQSACTKTS